MSTKKLRKPRRKRLFIHLINDDVNDFDFVIKVLMTICAHNYYQAHQCALLVHNKGRCNIYSGLGIEVILVYQQLVKNGLTVELKNKKL